MGWATRDLPGRAHQPNLDRGPHQGRTMMRIRFSTTDCKPCALKPHCTRAPRRLLTPRRREEYEALKAARIRKAGKAFAAEYRHRGHVVVGRGSHAPAPCPLRRARQNPPAARAHGCRHEPRPPRIPDRRDTTCENAPIRFRPAYGYASPYLRPCQQHRYGEPVGSLRPRIKPFARSLTRPSYLCSKPRFHTVP